MKMISTFIRLLVISDLLVFVARAGPQRTQNYYQRHLPNSFYTNSVKRRYWVTPSQEMTSDLRGTLQGLANRFKDKTPNFSNHIGKPEIAKALFWGYSLTSLAAGFFAIVNINDRLDSNKQSIRETCMAVSSILSIQKPQCQKPQPGNIFAPTPSNPEAVSCSLGTREGESYTIIFPVGAVSGQTVSTLNQVPGLTIKLPTQNNAALTTVANTAPSILDFDRLRSDTIQAIDILDQKIRDIVMTTAPNCP